MTKKKKPKVIEVRGRRWFQRTYGNTYHSVEIRIDGKQVHRIPFQYGYDTMYMQNARAWLIDNGYLPGIDDSFQGISVYCRENGIILVDTVHDVPRKKDL